MDDLHSLQRSKYCLIHCLHNSRSTHVLDILHEGGMLVVNGYATFLDIVSFLKTFTQWNMMMRVSYCYCWCCCLLSHCVCGRCSCLVSVLNFTLANSCIFFIFWIQLFTPTKVIKYCDLF